MSGPNLAETKQLKKLERSGEFSWDDLHLT